MENKKKYVIFGAGWFGVQALKLIGKEKIEFYVDNDVKKDGSYIEGIEVLLAKKIYDQLKTKNIIIAVSEEYYNEIIEQLNSNGIKKIILFKDFGREIIRSQIKNRKNYIEVYNKAINWVLSNTLKEETGSSVVCTSTLRKGYPEVTGYFIPSLIRAGYKSLAIEYAKWLCSIQHDDGAWWDTDNKAPYTFDSAQVLKGLLSIRKIASFVDSHIIKGCDWLITNIQKDGHVTTSNESAVGNTKVCSELIHLYCLSPLIEAADIFNKNEYKEKAILALNYYKKNFTNKILDFDILSHFYAYIIEALLDLGEFSLARNAMEKIDKLQAEDGSIPAYRCTHWVCSTGIFQFAVIWFRLGDYDRGERAFRYAMSLQNNTGGWYGSYPSADNKEQNNYFAFSEISWAVKFFLDALNYRNILNFENLSSIFLDHIDKEDGRYKFILNEVGKLNKNSKVLDVGCGKGRYLNNLIVDNPDINYYGVDISSSVLDYIVDKRISTRLGSLTNIPFEDDFFDIAFACESLEHSIDIKASIKELARVVKPGGHIIIIDKNAKSLGVLKIEEWEQWFTASELKKMMALFCDKVEVIDDLLYDNNKHDLFIGWNGLVNSKRNII